MSGIDRLDPNKHPENEMAEEEDQCENCGSNGVNSTELFAQVGDSQSCLFDTAYNFVSKLTYIAAQQKTVARTEGDHERIRRLYFVRNSIVDKITIVAEVYDEAFQIFIDEMKGK